MRAVVYRIQQPAVKEGTGIIFKEGKSLFLITNLHTLKNDSDNVCDSIFIFLNRITDTGEIISGPQKRTIHLIVNGDSSYFLPIKREIDLVLISMGPGNWNFEKEDSVYSLNTLTLLTKEEMYNILDNVSVATAIGYPGKGLNMRERSPEYRWGYFIGKEDVYLKFDIPILRGNSGSPVIIRKNGKYHLAGIMTKLDELRNISYAIPQSQIKQQFHRYFELIKSK